MTKTERDELRELLAATEANEIEARLPWTAQHDEVLDDNGDVVMWQDSILVPNRDAVGLAAAAVSALPALLDAADERDRLADVLARVEWSAGDRRRDPWCPKCSGSRPVHMAGCTLAVALGRK